MARCKKCGYKFTKRGKRGQHNYHGYGKPYSLCGKCNQKTLKKVYKRGFW